MYQLPSRPSASHAETHYMQSGKPRQRREDAVVSESSSPADSLSFFGLLLLLESLRLILLHGNDHVPEQDHVRRYRRQCSRIC